MMPGSISTGTYVSILDLILKSLQKFFVPFCLAATLSKSGSKMPFAT